MDTIVYTVEGKEKGRYELPLGKEKIEWKFKVNEKKLIENEEKLIEKAARQGDKLTGNRISILRLVMDDPYISKADLSKLVGISVAAISANIEVMRGKYLRRVGPDKGGFWEIIEE